MTEPNISFGLSQKTLDKLRSVFGKYGQIDAVILYGSRAVGNYCEGSDIDLTIQSSHLGFDQLLQIENELDDLLLPYKIDLSIFSQIDNQNLIEHIQRVGKVFYQKHSK